MYLNFGQARQMKYLHSANIIQTLKDFVRNSQLEWVCNGGHVIIIGVIAAGVIGWHSRRLASASHLWLRQVKHWVESEKEA